MNYYLAPWKKYATFSGRAQRAEYWTFMLINFAVIGAWIILGELLGDKHIIPLIGGTFMAALLIPSIAVTARRLHDMGRCGWWMLIKLIPLVGSIVMLVFLLSDSQSGDNTYGPNPKGISGKAPETLSPTVQ